MAVFLVLLSGVGFLRALYTLNISFPFSNEGWTAYHAADAIAGRALYSGAGRTIYNNYPPLGFYLIGYLGQVIGDTILAGRILSVIAFMALAGGVYSAARALGARRQAALFGAGVFAATFVFDYDYVGVCDPQILANAVQIWGLVCFLRAPHNTARMALAAFLFVTAFFIKHAVITQSLAAAAFIIMTDRRNAFKFIGFGLLIGLSGLALFQLTYGHSLYSQLHDPRVWWLRFALSAWGGRMPAALLPLITAIFLLRRFSKDAAVIFSVSYLFLSVILAFYFLGGAGTGGKMLFDMVIALGLCAAIGADRWGRVEPRYGQMFALCQLLPVILILSYRSVTGALPHHWLSYEAPAVRDTARDVAFLKAQKGPVLCSEPALCFWAGKDMEFDLWGYGQAVSVHVRDGHELLEAFETRRFTAMQMGRAPNFLDAPPEADPLFAAKANRAIAENYTAAFFSWTGVIYLPKPAARKTSAH
jgi:hypothetical protein